MSKPPDVVVKLSESLVLCEYQSPKNGSFGFWLYDKTRGMNLSMRATCERAAFTEAITYYQGNLLRLENEYANLRSKVDCFIAQFEAEED